LNKLEVFELFKGYTKIWEVLKILSLFIQISCYAKLEPWENWEDAVVYKRFKYYRFMVTLTISLYFLCKDKIHNCKKNLQIMQFWIWLKWLNLCRDFRGTLCPKTLKVNHLKTMTKTTCSWEDDFHINHNSKFKENYILGVQDAVNVVSYSLTLISGYYCVYFYLIECYFDKS